MGLKYIQSKTVRLNKQQSATISVINNHVSFNHTSVKLSHADCVCLYVCASATLSQTVYWLCITEGRHISQMIVVV